MPILNIAQFIAEAHQDDIRMVLGDQPMPPLNEKAMFKLAYTGDDLERKAAFYRLQHLTGVIAEY